MGKTIDITQDESLTVVSDAFGYDTATGKINVLLSSTSFSLGPKGINITYEHTNGLLLKQEFFIDIVVFEGPQINLKRYPNFGGRHVYYLSLIDCTNFYERAYVFV